MAQQSSSAQRAYEHHTGPELAELERRSPETFATLRRDWIARGEPAFEPKAVPPPATAARTSSGKLYEELSGPEAAALEEADPKAHAALRREWQKRGEPTLMGDA
jgi:hypothetical protein